MISQFFEYNNWRKEWFLNETIIKEHSRHRCHRHGKLQRLSLLTVRKRCDISPAWEYAWSGMKARVCRFYFNVLVRRLHITYKAHSTMLVHTALNWNRYPCPSVCNLHRVDAWYSLRENPNFTQVSIQKVNLLLILLTTFYNTPHATCCMIVYIYIEYCIAVYITYRITVYITYRITVYITYCITVYIAYCITVYITYCITVYITYCITVSSQRWIRIYNAYCTTVYSTYYTRAFNRCCLSRFLVRFRLMYSVKIWD